MSRRLVFLTVLAAASASAQVYTPPPARPLPYPTRSLPYPSQTLSYPSSSPFTAPPVAPTVPVAPPGGAAAPYQPLDAAGAPPLQPYIPPSSPPPAASSVTPPPEAIPAPVASRDMQVSVRILNKSSGRRQISDVPVGTVIQYETLEVLPEACWYDARAKSAARSAALLQIYERKPNLTPVRLFSGWMFADRPSASHLSHPYYDVALVRCVPNDAPKAQAEAEKTDEAGAPSPSLGVAEPEGASED